MSKNMKIAAVVVLLIAALLYYKGMKKDDMNGTGGSDNLGGSGGSGNGSITYKCEQGKTFKLSYVDADTVTLTGSGIPTTTLNKNIVGYLMSVDGKTVVKTAGNFIVLTQNDLVTHDKCAPM